ncbi:choice-of-anchor A family protein [Agromyces protaetiae]|uniref:choice-of-anchor A family protein n=1 Tax=Agromyces protaetiae TaxID=2509455 RepID=UPI0013EB6E73|nr:choice-of-anchor A family protein [Agromyces protaetiae]
MGKRVERWSGITVAALGVALVVGATPAAFAVLPDGNTPLDPCLGPACPTEWIPPHNGAFLGFDDAVSVFVGGDFQVLGSSAEAEGNLVVMGSAEFNRGIQGTYNLGVVGVGSRVPPPPGSDMLLVGGDLTIADTTDLQVGGFSSPPAPLIFIAGNVRYGGTLNARAGQPTLIDQPGQVGTITQDPDAVAAFAPRVGNITALSQCYAEQPATGSFAVDATSFTLQGNGSATLQVFNVDVPVQGTGGGQVTLNATGIPDGATIVINLVGDAALVNANSWAGVGLDADLTQRILWNVPTASSALFTGTIQLPGSILVGNPASTTTIEEPGTNGRIEVAGNLVQQSSVNTSGLEFHAYPFNGTVVECATTPTTEPTTTEPTEPTTTEPTTTVPDTTEPTTTAPDTTEPTTATATAPTSTLAETGGGGLTSLGGASLLAGLVLIAAGTGLSLHSRARRGSRLE